MVILIDAYNLLKRIHGNHITETQKSHLMTMLRTYVQRKGHTVYVVFDGGDSLHSQQHIGSRLVTIYAGYQKSADDVLKVLMKKSWAFNGVLISNDRELQRDAAMHEIDSFAVELFYDILTAPRAVPLCRAQQQSAVRKYASTDSNEEVDQLLTAFSDRVPVKEEEERSLRIAGQMLSKEQRRREHKLRKLS